MAAPFFVMTFVFLWLLFLWELYLSYRQHKVYKNTAVIPEELINSLDKETFEKSRLYQLDKSNFGILSNLYTQVETSIILLFDGIPFLWFFAGLLNLQFGYDSSYEILQSLTFIVLANMFGTISNLPWSLYSNFVIEEKHGFNKQTIAFYFKDLIKKQVVSMLIMLPITCVLLFIIKWGGEYFFLYAWAFIFVVSLFFIAIYHDYIAPLFDVFMALPDGELKTSIENLAKNVQFPLSKVLVVEGSKRSSHSNAYFFGFYKKKVIVLFDTLLRVSPFEEGRQKKENDKEEDKSVSDEVKGNLLDNEDGAGMSTGKEISKEETGGVAGCDNGEILAILGHELGHWKMNHVLKNLAITQVNLLLSFFVFGLLMNNEDLYKSFGFYQTQPTVIGLIIIFQFVFSPYNELMGFVMTVLSRFFEFQADDFGVKLGFSDNLQSALMKLHKENLGFPVADSLYSAYHYSHPPLLERLRALRKKTE